LLRGEEKNTERGGDVAGSFLRWKKENGEARGGGGLEGKKCDGEERGVRVFIGRREE